MTRRDAASNGSRRCIVQRLSHSTRSPTRQRCAEAEGRTRRVRPDFVQQRLGVRKLQPLDPGHAPAAEIQHAAPALRMGADQRVQRAGRLPRIVGRRYALPHIAAAVVSTVMFDPQTCHAGAGRPAATRTRCTCRRTTCRRRRAGPPAHTACWLWAGGQIGHVGVPHGLAGAQAADRHAVFNDIRNDVDFRHALDEAPAVLLHRRVIEVAEAGGRMRSGRGRATSGRGTAAPDGLSRPGGGPRSRSP